MLSSIRATFVGESAFPEDLDTRTEMKWEVIVAIYQTNNGAVYVDTNPWITPLLSEEKTSILRRCPHAN